MSEVSKQSASFVTQVIDPELSMNRQDPQQFLSYGKQSMSQSNMLSSGASGAVSSFLTLLSANESLIDTQKLGSIDSMAHILFNNSSLLPRPPTSDVNGNPSILPQNPKTAVKVAPGNNNSNNRLFIRSNTICKDEKSKSSKRASICAPSTDNESGFSSTLDVGLIDYCIVLGWCSDD